MQLNTPTRSSFVLSFAKTHLLCIGLLLLYVTSGHADIIFSDDFSEYTTNAQNGDWGEFTTTIPSYTSALNTTQWQPVNPGLDPYGMYFGVDIGTSVEGYTSTPADTKSTVSAYVTGSGYAGGVQTPILTGSGSANPGSPVGLNTTAGYTISLDLGNSQYWTPSNGSVVVNLLAGSTIVGSATFSPGLAAPYLGWANVSFTIPASALMANYAGLNGQPLTIQLLNNSYAETHLDFTNLQIAETLPPGEFKIVADAATTVVDNQPTTAQGPYILRAEYNQWVENKAYIRFYVGWAKGHHISSASLHLTGNYWGDWGNVPKVFGVYALKKGTSGNQTFGWNENTMTASTAPGNLLNQDAFDPTTTDKIDDWTITNNPSVSAGSPVVPFTFNSPNLATEIAADTDGYITLMIVLEGGSSDDSVFQPRTALGNLQPWLDIVTDAPNSLDETQPAFIVTNGVRQTISGYGTGIGPSQAPPDPTSYYFSNGVNLGALSPSRLQQFFHTEYTDTGSNTARLWFYDGNNGNNDTTSTGIEVGTLGYNNFVNAYINTGVVSAAEAAGVTRFILVTNPPSRFIATSPTPDSGGYLPLSDSGVQDYPAYLAEFVARVKSNLGLNIAMVCVANEEVAITVAQWPQVVKNLRQELDNRGLTNVKISGVDWATNDDWAAARLSSIQSDPVAWSDLDVCNTHSYAIPLSEQFYEQYSQDQGKEFWMTESEATGPTQTSVGKDLSGHLMSDLSHGATCWLYHEAGLEESGDYTSCLLGFDSEGPDNSWLNISPKYHYFKSITTSFPVGTTMRRIWNSNMGDPWYSPYSIPQGLVTAGQNADGSWSVAVLNPAEDSDPNPQRTYTIAIEELAGIPSLPVSVVSLGEGDPSQDNSNTATGVTYVPLSTSTSTATINNGLITVTLGPNQLLTLHSTPVTRH